MPEHQKIQQSKKPDTIFLKQATPIKQIPLSNPIAIIQRAKINPKSLTHADVMQLQRTIGNRAIGKLLSEIGFIPSTAKPVQRQEIPEEEEPLQGKMAETIQRQEIPEEKEPLQGKMIETIQRQEIPEEEEEPLQGKMIGTVQKQEIQEEEEPLQGKMIETVQRQEIPEEEEPLQGKMADIVQRQEMSEEEEPAQMKRENNTRMPDNLKAGVENLSGIDMSDVRVHYNSDKPAEVGALAYTQGANIHVAPGQERHLPHEAWHVVQQKQRRVQATTQMKGLGINDDPSLEHEADMMGAKTAQLNALAYMQGTDIHLGPGQERYLAHEAWHMVQQKYNTKEKFPSGEPCLQLMRIDVQKDQLTYSADFQHNHGRLVENGVEQEIALCKSRGVDKNTTFLYEMLPQQIRVDDQFDQQLVEVNIIGNALYVEKNSGNYNAYRATGPLVIRLDHKPTSYEMAHLQETRGIDKSSVIMSVPEGSKPRPRIIKPGALPPTNLFD